MEKEYDFSEASRGIVDKVKREGFTRVAPGHKELGSMMLATICPKLDDELRQHLQHYVELCNRMADRLDRRGDDLLKSQGIYVNRTD